MADENGIEESVKTKRKPRERVRRNFKAELDALQARVDTAVRLLMKVEDAPALVQVALEMLEEG